MLSRSVADQAGAATAAPRSRVYRWSSGRQPKTRPSAASLCYEGWSVRSPKFGAGNRHIASASASPIHKHSGSRIEDTQNHPASGGRPSTFDKPLRWRTATEIRARSWETSGEPPDYTTPWGPLKQPDKPINTMLNVDVGVHEHTIKLSDSSEQRIRELAGIPVPELTITEGCATNRLED